MKLDAMTARVRQQWEEGQRLDRVHGILDHRLPDWRRSRKSGARDQENGWVVGYENCTGRKRPSNAWQKRAMSTTRWRINIWRLAAPCLPNDQR
ncbi:hypothetical protein ACVXHA_02820 [Escherichia coli]